MKIKKYIYIASALALFSACNDLDPVYTVGEADNAICLTAGVREGGSGVQTRAFNDDDAHHKPTDTGGGHKLLQEGTKFKLQVRGGWTGHGDNNVVKQFTTATISAETATGSKHNKVEFTKNASGTTLPEILYWDDYGTADPNNTENRNAGLSLYAVAVDGETTAPDIEDNKWAGELEWQLNTNGSNVLKKDILVSNNLTGDDAFKFDDYKKIVSDAADKNVNAGLLEFRHMMSKITINLTAQDGFPTDGAVGTTTKKFAKAPIFELGTSTGTLTPYAIANGTVNVEAAKAVAGTTDADKAVVKAEAMAQPTSADVTVSMHALVYPDTQFGTSDDYIIGRLNADDNVYYITAAKIRAAIFAKFGAENVNDYKAMAGYNYILNIVVNKTEIHVSATVTDWIDVKAETVTPVISVPTIYSASGDVTPSEFISFSFYRSQGEPYATTPAQHIDYEYNPNLKSTDGYYAAEAVATGTVGSETPWVFKDLTKTNTTALYWPTHSSHYHMRGVWPETVTTTVDYDWSSPSEKHPRVSTVSNEDNTQIIQVSNVGYAKNTFPSDLLIGAPVFTEENKACANPDHTSVDQSKYGICATKGTITLNFKYMMSQVEVHLQTSETTAPDRVKLEGATVEIVNGYTDGYITLGERTAVPQTKADYTLATCDVTNNSDSVNIRRSAVIPQSLSYTDGESTVDLKFKITIKNSDTPGDTDTYFATIKNIKATTDGGETYTKNISAWEHGKRYIYKLDIRKTEIMVTASLTDWITVEAFDNVWL